MTSDEQGDLAALRVHVLGPLRVTNPQGSLTIPRAAHDIVALIAAAGPDGISRDAMAQELWGSSRPESWMSAMRNRMTAARKALGPTALLSSSGRYCFGPQVRVDSWDLIAHDIDDADPMNELAFLEGEPLADIADSPLKSSHAQRVHEARVAQIDLALHTGCALSTRALQSLRIYQRENQLDAPVAVATVQAHLASGQRDHAASVVAGVKAAIGTTTQLLPWVLQLERLLDGPDDATIPGPSARPQAVEARAQLFRYAARHQNWSLALEIAMEGLPEAELIEGDPERLALFNAIPISDLDPSLQFALALALTRHLVYADQEAEALQWAATTRSLASTPDEKLLSYITSAFVSDAADERTPIPLPAAFDDAPSVSINMLSLQVAVMNHLERDSYDRAAALQRRFTSLVETCAEPYRRWHLLGLQSMTKFVSGELRAAQAAAQAAHQYAGLFGITDAEITLIGQLSNARLIDPGFPGIDNYVADYPASADSNLSRALQAVDHARRSGGDAVDQFLQTYNYRSRTFFTFAVVTLVAPFIRDTRVRSEVETRLRARTGTSAIWGTGALHLGPVDRTVAQLVDEPDETRQLLTDAVAIADRQRTRVWQVICRLDLAAVTNQSSHHDDAVAYATTSDLEHLVSAYRPMFRFMTD